MRRPTVGAVRLHPELQTVQHGPIQVGAHMLHTRLVPTSGLKVPDDGRECENGCRKVFPFCPNTMFGARCMQRGNCKYLQSDSLITTRAQVLQVVYTAWGPRARTALTSNCPF